MIAYGIVAFACALGQCRSVPYGWADRPGRPRAGSSLNTVPAKERLRQSGAIRTARRRTQLTTASHEMEGHDPGPEVASARAVDALGAAAEPIELPGNGATVRIGTASWTDPTMVAG